MRRRAHSSSVLMIIMLMASAAAVQAASITFDPGTYGSYKADSSLVGLGTYSLAPDGTASWVFNDKSGLQTATLGAGTYWVRARDAAATIGTFTVDGSDQIVNVTGGLSLAGSTLSFVNQTVNVNAPAEWRKQERIWNLAWDKFDIARFDLPAGTRSGWFGHVYDNNDFTVTVDASGNVTVNSDARSIGLTGGLNQLNFPASTLVPLQYSVSGTIPGFNWLQLDWSQGIPNGPSTGTFWLYPGQYSLVSSVGSGTWTPVLSGGSEHLQVPLHPNYNSTSWVFHSNTSGLDYIFTVRELIPEPSMALLLALAGAGLALVRRAPPPGEGAQKVTGVSSSGSA